MNLTMHIDKSIDSLDQKLTETHSNTETKVSELATKSKQMELTLTAVEKKIQKTDVNFGLLIKQQQNLTVTNLTMHIDKSIDSLDQKLSETHNNTEAKVSKLSTKSKQMELNLTAVEEKIQKTDSKFRLLVKQQQKSTVMNLTMHIDKSIDSLDRKLAEIHSNTRAKVSELSTKSKQMELTLTSANDKIQSLRTDFKELEAKTRENGELFEELKTQMANDEARLQAIVKRVDKLKSEKSVTDKELIRKNINDLSKKVSRTEQNTKDIYDRIEKLNKNIAKSINSQNNSQSREIKAIKAKIESQGKRLDHHDNKITQIEGEQVSLTEQTNAQNQILNILLESVRSSCRV